MAGRLGGTGAKTLADLAGPRRLLVHLTLRGGRMTKVAGRAASCAPSLGAVFGLAVSVATSLGTSAQAGTCAWDGINSWVCTGPPAPGDAGQFLGASVASPVTVTAQPGFGLTTTDTIGIGAFALYGRTGADLDLNNLVTLSAAELGLMATTTSYGAPITVQVAGTIQGGGPGLPGGVGIQLSNAAGGGVSLSGPVSVYGSLRGIDIQMGNLVTPVSGQITATLSGPTNSGAGGAEAIRLRGYGGDITLDTSGAVTAPSGAGIVVDQSGYGAVSVSTGVGEVQGLGGHGIDLRTTPAALGGIDVTIGAGGVIGRDHGVMIDSQGQGPTGVTVTGAVSGQTGHGLSVNSLTGGVQISSTPGAQITGALRGISALAMAGAVTVNAEGAIVGGSDSGLYASTGFGDITVTTQAVSGGTDGVHVVQAGSGSTRITSQDQVTGTTGHGIRLTVQAGGLGDAEVFALGAVSGQGAAVSATQMGSGALRVTTGAGTLIGDNGIVARSLGSGALVVTATGRVEGRTGAAITLYGGGTGDIDVTTGTATVGAQDGLDIDNRGGDLAIALGGATQGTSGDGVRAVNTGGTLTLTGTGAITGGTNGLHLTQGGSGPLLVTTYTGVSGGTGAGVDLNNQTGAGLSLTSHALVQTSGGHAVWLRNQGTGATTLDLRGGAQVSGASGGDAIRVDHTSAGALSMTISGAVDSLGGFGLFATTGAVAGSSTTLVVGAGGVAGQFGGASVHNGAGALHVQGSGVFRGTGAGAHGLEVYNSAALGGELTLVLDQAHGGNSGLVVNNQGNGATAVQVNTAASGLGGTAMQVTTGSNSGALDISTGAGAGLTGGTVGLHVSHGGSGPLVIGLGGAVLGQAGDGITLRKTGAGGGDITLTTQAVTGQGGDGIDVINQTSGSLTVTSLGPVSGLAGDGVRLENQAGTLDLVLSSAQVTGAGQGISLVNQGSGRTQLTTTGSVSGGTDGISVSHHGQAGLVLDLHGDVTGTSGSAILAYNSANDVTGSMQIDLGAGRTIQGAVHGLAVENHGGSMTVTGAGATIVGDTGHGVWAQNGATAGDMILATGAVSGGQAGLMLRNFGTGTTGVTVLGPITGGTGAGLDLITGSATSGALVHLGAVSSQAGDAVTITHAGTGAARIDASGLINAASGRGLALSNAAAGSDLVAHLSGVTAQQDGVSLTQTGGGTTDLTATQAISSAAGWGVTASSAASATNMTVTVTDVAGAAGGLYLRHAGQGALTLSATGTVISQGGVGLWADVSGGGDLAVTTAAVSGGTTGIALRNLGGGATTLTTQGAVTGGARGIDARANGALGLTLGADIRATGPGGIGVQADGQHGLVLTQAVGSEAYGTTHGLWAENATGDMQITTDGQVTGRDGIGLAALSGQSGRDVVVTASGITGQLAGAWLENQGNGVTTLTATDHIAAGTGTGVRVLAGATTGMADLSVVSVQGGTQGISLQHDGIGASRVTALGHVAASTGLAVQTVTQMGVELNLASVAGGAGAIHVLNAAQGDVRLATTGPVGDLSGTGVAIAVTNLATREGGVTVSTDQAVSGGSGILVNAQGWGATEVTALGPVSATSGDGIVVTTLGTGDLRLETGAVTAQGAGISTYSALGTTQISTSGALSGDTGAGLIATSGTGAEEMTITTNATVRGGQHGIALSHQGQGLAQLTVNAGVTATSGAGILAESLSGADLRVTVLSGPVQGASHGIATRGAGAAQVDVTLATQVTGTTALALLGDDTTTSRVTLSDGATLNGDIALYNDAGHSVVTAGTGAAIRGAVLLGAGNDRVDITGADLSDVTLMDGGGDATDPLDGWDELTLADTSLGLMAEALTGWERINLAANATLGVGAGLFEVGALHVADSALLDLGHGAVTITGDVTLDGQMSLQNGDAGDVIRLGGDFTSTGTLFLDADFASDTADRLEIAGDVSGVTTLAIADLSAGEATGHDLVLVDVSGVTGEGDFELAGGPIFRGAFSYDLNLHDGQWVLGEELSIIASSFEATPSVLLGFTALPTLADRQAARIWASDDGMRSTWLRFVGDLQNSSLQTLSGADVTRRRAVGLQAGLDLRTQPGAGGQWILGANARHDLVSGTVQSDTGTAQIDAIGHAIGLSATWEGTGGSWLDFQAQMGWQESDVSTTVTGKLLDGHDSSSLSFGVEVGHRFDLPFNAGLSPQASLTWMKVSGGGATDTRGNHVVLGVNERLQGRAGVAFDLPTAAGEQVGNVQLIGNLLHDFSGPNHVMVDATALEARGPSTWVELGLGGNLETGQGGAFFATGRYRQRLAGGGQGGDFGLSLSAGFSKSW